jgi:hypothetical protein
MRAGTARLRSTRRLSRNSNHLRSDGPLWSARTPGVYSFSFSPEPRDVEQCPWLEALHVGDAEISECRLLQRDDEWYLHVTATRDVKARSVSTDRTPVGVDLGNVVLATVCYRDERGTSDWSRPLQRRRLAGTPPPQNVCVHLLRSSRVVLMHEACFEGVE